MQVPPGKLKEGGGFLCGGGCDDLLISNATLRVAAARVFLLLPESDVEEDQLITTFCKSLTQPPTATALPGNYTNIPLTS
jgi:hypothetical protein